jgi:putative glutamine amidotransferase
MAVVSKTVEELVEEFGPEVITNFLTIIQENSTDAKTVEQVTEYLANVAPVKKVEVSPEEKVKLIANIKVGITYEFSFNLFRHYYPNLKVIKDVADVKNFDLIIVPGGADVNPKYYGESNKASDINEARDEQEVPIVQEAFKLRKKVYAVCRGHQLVNILKGCSFVQDIFSYGYKPHLGYHKLTFTTDKGILYKFFNGIDVTSTHHQGVLSTPLKTICTHQDIVEGTESSTIITTQFHPEFMEGMEPFFEYLKGWAFNLQ